MLGCGLKKDRIAIGCINYLQHFNRLDVGVYDIRLLYEGWLHNMNIHSMEIEMEIEMEYYEGTD